MTAELYHHGVKGQHWGKRNGPPYPLYRKSAYYKKTGKRPPGYTGDKSSKGKIGKLPDDMKGYRKINSDDMYDANFVRKYNKIKPKKEDAKNAAEVIKNAKLGAGNRVLSTIPIMTSAAFLGKGLASRDKAARRLYLGGAALTGGVGLAQNIIGRRQQKKARNQATELTNKMIKQSKVKDIKAYDGQMYVKDKRGSIGGLSDIKRAGDTSWVRKRLKKGKIGSISDSTSDEERKAKLKKRILKGAGIAAGAAALAGAGYLAYKNRAAIGSRAGKLRDDIRYGLGEIPGTAKLNQTRINLKNKILGAGKNVGNAARNAGAKVRNVAAKPSQTVYNKIAGKSKSALNVAKNESQVARNNARTLKNFMDDNARSIEKTTIAKRQALAKIRRGEGNLKELNQTANNLAVREKALIAKQNTARALAPKAVAERVSKAEAVRQAQDVFARQNKLGRIAAGATNAGIGLGLAGAAGGAGYGINRLARKRRSRRRRRR